MDVTYTYLFLSGYIAIISECGSHALVTAAVSINCSVGSLWASHFVRYIRWRKKVYVLAGFISLQ